jgi:hypothetical protein
MINEEVLSEKLKYLIQMNAKANQFNVEKIAIEFEYIDQLHTKLDNYDIDIKFDYEGRIDFDLYSFVQDIKAMSDKLQAIISEYVITKEGRIVSSSNSNCYTTEPLIFNIQYEVDTKHVFELGFKFRYDED